MSRPTILLLDPRADRLQGLSHHLTADGYEVVPLADAAQGRRFARGLGAALTVATTEALQSVADPAELLAELATAADGAERTLVVLGDRPEDEEHLPDTAAFLVAAGLRIDEIARRVRLVLLGRELNLDPDTSLTSLLGDLSRTPLFDLLRGLATAGVSGRMELRGGALLLERGRVVAVAAGGVRGSKAFCRLGRLHEGPVKLMPGDLAAGAAREIEEDLGTLIFAAIEDSLVELPDPRVRLELDLKPAFFSTVFTPVQQQILGLVQRGATAQQVLDGATAHDGTVAQEIRLLTELGVLLCKEPEAQVRIVTDSTSDLPPDLARAYGITVVPLTVSFGKQIYRDRIDLQPGQFYPLLTRSKDHPASAPPPVTEFVPLFRNLLDQGHEVVSLHISAKLSKTFENANAAAKAELARAGGARRLAVLDTGQVSAGLGLLALFAARMATRKEPAERIIRRLRDMAPRVHTLFVVDTLEYLARGGRIGRARALLGGLLRIKPILGVVEGEVAPLGQALGGRNAQPRLLDVLAERIDPRKPLIALIGHADVPALADRLEGTLRERFQVIEAFAIEVGPAVGANAGPGFVGVAAFQPTDAEAGLIAPL